MIKTTLKPRLAEVGKIKIGMKGEPKKSQGGKEFRMPVKLDHFIVTSTDKGPDGNFIIDDYIMGQLGDSPTEIPIRLLFDDIDMNFHTAFQYYHGKKCVCRGDGEKATRTLSDKTTKEIDCIPDKCEFFTCEPAKCKVSGVLSCTLPISQYIGGVYRFRTHSWNSVSGILAALQYFQANTNGILQGLPLKLKFIKKHTEDHGSVPTVTIVLDAVQLNEMRQLAVMEAQNRLQLGVDMRKIEETAKNEGFLLDYDDPADVQEEFYAPAIEEPKKEKGVSSDDLAAKIADKKQPEAGQKKPDDDQCVI